MSKTDKELFRDYLMSKVEGTSSTVSSTYFAKDGHEFYDLDHLLRSIATAIVDHEPEPLAELDYAIEKFSGVVLDLQRVKAGFIAFRAIHTGEAA